MAVKPTIKALDPTAIDIGTLNSNTIIGILITPPLIPTALITAPTVNIIGNTHLRSRAYTFPSQFLFQYQKGRFSLFIWAQNEALKFKDLIIDIAEKINKAISREPKTLVENLWEIRPPINEPRVVGISSISARYQSTLLDCLNIIVEESEVTRINNRDVEAACWNGNPIHNWNGVYRTPPPIPNKEAIKAAKKSAEVEIMFKCTPFLFFQLKSLKNKES